MLGERHIRGSEEVRGRLSSSRSRFQASLLAPGLGFARRCVRHGGMLALEHEQQRASQRERKAGPWLREAAGR
jgi:hypothetical protein